MGAIVFFVILLLIYILWRNICKPVYLFYRDSCPYCVKIKPEWKRFEMNCMISMILPIRIDMTDPNNQELVSKFNINSVPTIIKVENNIPFKYNGNRTAQDLYKWACNNEL